MYSSIQDINALLSHDVYFSRSLAGNPAPLPGSKPPICIHFSSNGFFPELSIVMPIYNQEFLIERVLDGIAEHTLGNYELILIVDACSDMTEQKVLSWVERKRGQVDSICRCLIIRSETPLFECAADNIGFALSRSNYCLEIQADLIMTETGYNHTLVRPFQLRDDVIGVSGRSSCGLYGDRAVGRAGIQVEHPYDASLSPSIFYVHETCIRGPLLLDRRKLEVLGFLDEQNFYLDNSDHDLFVRAWHHHQWICGYVPINFETCLADGSTRKKRDPLNQLFLEQRKLRGGNGFYHLNHAKYRPRPQSFISLVDGTQTYSRSSLKQRARSALRSARTSVANLRKRFNAG